MATGNILIPMGRCMKVCGWRIFKTARDRKHGWMAVAIKAIIIRAKNKEKGTKLYRFFIRNL